MVILLDGVMMWSSSAGLRPHNQKLPSAQIEMASYVLLAHINRGSLFDGITQMKWLSTQRNHLGGYGTTQVRQNSFSLTDSHLCTDI